MCDINDIMVKQEVTEDTSNEETFILPDTEITSTDIKPEITDAEMMNTETHVNKSEPESSKTSTVTVVKQEVIEHTTNKETYILPDTAHSDIKEDIKVADNKSNKSDDVHYKPSRSSITKSQPAEGGSAH